MHGFFSKDKALSQAIVGYVSVQMIYNVVRRLLGLEGWQNAVFLILLLSAWCIRYAVKAVVCIKNKDAVWLFMAELLAVVLYFCTYLMGNLGTETGFKYMIYTCVSVIPFSIMAYCIKDVKILYQVMKKSSYWQIALLSLMWFVHNEGYVMSYSYWLLWVSLIHINEFFKRKNIGNLILVIYELFTILVIGSRGPVLCIGVYIILRIFTEKKYRKVQVALLAVGGMFIVYYNQIGQVLLKLFNDLGIQSRSLTLLLTNIKYLSGREWWYETTIQYIKMHPHMGNGIAGYTKIFEDYPHNLILEIYFSFGIWIGTGLILGLTYLIYKSMKIHGNEKEILLILLAYGGVQLLISGTFLKSFIFGMFLAIAISTIQKKKQKQRNRYKIWIS